MAGPTFRGDPYRVLDVAPDADDDAIKRRWRELARQHHPDRSAGDPEATARSTTRMARINAAYDLLRDPERRFRFDRSAAGRRAHTSGEGGRRRHENRRATFDSDGVATDARGGPPPPPRTRPVTARFDTTGLFHRRNATTSDGRTPLRGHSPLSNRDRHGAGEDLRASTPTGPVRSRRTADRLRQPSLEESLGTELEFGKFRGHTLGEVAVFEPTYIDWIAGTITRDRDLVMRARVIQGELDRQGVWRRPRSGRSGADGRAREDGALH